MIKRMKLIPPRLTPGPSLSVAHPNPAIPAIEAAIPPVAKLVKTRPSNGAGVSSCSVVQTNGVNIAVLTPIMGALSANLSSRGNAVQCGHTNIHHHDVWLKSFHCGNGFFTVCCFANHFQILVLFKNLSESSTDQGFIIYD